MPNVVFITSRAVALDGIEYTYSVYQTAKSGTSGIRAWRSFLCAANYPLKTWYNQAPAVSLSA